MGFLKEMTGSPASRLTGRLNAKEKEKRRLNMTKRSMLTQLLVGAVVTAVLVHPSLAAAAGNDAKGERVVVTSTKSFEQTSDAVKSLVAKNGMMVMAEVDQGNMLSMTGLSLKAKLLLIGNPNVGKQLFEQNHAVGLYVPLRLFVYNDENGKTQISYDKPSALLAKFDNDRITMVAQMLDKKLEDLATMAAR